MTKFRIGDPVRVIRRTDKFFDQVGTVSSIDGSDLPFEVSGVCSFKLWFGPDDLILAEHPTTDLAASDAVNHPPHYGGEDDPYEVIKVAEAWGFDKDAYLFNVLKYIGRSDKKGKTLEDHKKARFYLDRKIKQLEAEQ